MALAVLFRDAALAVVDKPSGLPVEADSGESVLAYAARELAPPGGRAWPRVVHRLDRGTSGCLLLALNQKAERALAKAFDEGLVEKQYLALVAGRPPEEGACDTPYGPDPRDRRRFTTRLQTPRRARLRWRVEECLGSHALLRVFLDTGRTHQIRVQLAESGFPVVGDEVYGIPGARLALHAEMLGIPWNGQRLEWRAPLPADFQAMLVRNSSS